MKNGFGKVLAVVAAVLLGLVGCGSDETPPIESFSKQWHEAVNDNDPEELYALLDAVSRRKIAHDLEVMRGLPPETQQAVINQLGGVRVSSLHELTPQAYFGQLWRQATQGLRPSMRIEARGDRTGAMVLERTPGQTQRIQLMVEGGRWVWMLPPQRLGPSRTGTADAAPPPSEPSDAPAASTSEPSSTSAAKPSPPPPAPPASDRPRPEQPDGSPKLPPFVVPGQSQAGSATL